MNLTLLHQGDPYATALQGNTSKLSVLKCGPEKSQFEGLVSPLHSHVTLPLSLCEDGDTPAFGGNAQNKGVAKGLNWDWALVLF